MKPRGEPRRDLGQPSRSEAARQRRIDAFLAAHPRRRRGFQGHLVQRCDCCSRFVRVDLLSERGWCLECEREFRRVQRFVHLWRAAPQGRA